MRTWKLIGGGVLAAASLASYGARAQSISLGMVDGWKLDDDRGSCSAATIYEGNIFVDISYDFGTNTARVTVTNPAWESVENRRSYDVQLKFANGDEWTDAGAIGLRSEGKDRMTGLRMSLDGDQFLTAFARSRGFSMMMGERKLAILSLKDTGPVADRLRQCAAASFKRYPPDPFKGLGHSNTNQDGAAGGRIEPSRAKASIASYISDADYPDSALRNHESGRVSFRLHVGTDGRVTACEITQSSGSAALDAATCRIMKSRARFTPAHDSSGNPVEDDVASELNWKLPTS
jgi:TonB family protein